MRLGLLLLLASCAYVQPYSTQYTGVAKFEPTDPKSVQVLATEPTQRHDRLGEVVLYASMDPPAPVADIEKEFREQASKWGANAVYVVRDTMVPSRKERELVGIAVRYR